MRLVVSLLYRVFYFCFKSSKVHGSQVGKVLACLPFVFSSLAYAQGELESQERTKIPVELSINGESLSPTVRAAVTAMVSALADNLYSWGTFPIQLPDNSAFQDGNKIIDVGDLYQEPTSDEASRIGIGEDGKQRRLTKEEVDTIGRSALIVIPSEEYPGMNHVLKLSTWVQKGSENIQVTLNQDRAKGYWHLQVAVPRLIFKEQAKSAEALTGKKSKINFMAGLANIKLGIRDTVSSFVGLLEDRPRYSDSDIADTIARLSFLQGYERAKANHPGSGYLQALDVAEINKAMPVLTEIEEQVEKMKVQFFEDLIRQNPNASEKEREAQWIAIRNEHFLDGIREREAQLEQLNPGLTQALLTQARVLKIVVSGEQTIRERFDAEKRVFLAQLAKDYPAQSLIGEWVDERVEKALGERSSEIKKQGYIEIENDLRKEGLNEAADMVRVKIEFLERDAKALQVMLGALRDPTRKFKYRVKIWRPTNYVTQEAEVESHDGKLIKIKYKADFVSREFGTNTKVWRLVDALYRSEYLFKNGLYGLVVRNYLNGPLGVKSMFGKEAFYGEKVFSSETGEWVDDTESRVETLRSRFRNLWKYVAQKNQEFAASSDNDLLPKAIKKPFHYLRYNVFAGVGGSALLLTGQPALTLLNTAVTATGTLTGFVWAPVSSFLMIGINGTIYDTRAPQPQLKYQLFPWVNNLIYRTGIKGLGFQTLGSLGLASGHAVVGEARLGLARARSVLRSGYDAFMRYVFLRPFGRVPGEGSELAERISGPGLSADYFFQIKPEVSVLTLRAVLENLELEAYRTSTQAAIEAPVDQHLRVINELMGSFVSLNYNQALPSNSRQEGLQKIEARSNQLSKELDKAVQERRAITRELTDLSVDRRTIRQTHEDLAKTLQMGAALVQDFYETRIFPRLHPVERRLFWIKKRLPEGSWTGLTKQLLAGVFSEGFLEPLNATDARFRKVIESPTLRSIFDIYEGKFAGAPAVEIAPQKSVESKVNLEVRLEPSRFQPRYAVPRCEHIFAKR